MMKSLINEGNGSIRHLRFAVSKINILFCFLTGTLYIEVIRVEVNTICVLNYVLNQAVPVI